MKKTATQPPARRVINPAPSQESIDRVEAAQAPAQPGDNLIDAEQSRVDQNRATKPNLPGLASETDTRLRSFIERVERLAAEISELQEDVKEIYGEAKANGYDAKIMRMIVRLRKMDYEKRMEQEALLDVYKRAVGME